MFESTSNVLAYHDDDSTGRQEHCRTQEEEVSIDDGLSSNERTGVTPCVTWYGDRNSVGVSCLAHLADEVETLLVTTTSQSLSVVVDGEYSTEFALAVVAPRLQNTTKAVRAQHYNNEEVVLETRAKSEHLSCV